MYNVLVVFNDDSKKIFNNVIEWGSTISDTCYYIKKNDPITNENYDTVMSFIRIDTVKYIGPVEFWEETVESKLIRCKDCEFFNEDPYYFRGRPCCIRLETRFLDNPIQVNPDDFCSRAVKRGENK